MTTKHLGGRPTSISSSLGARILELHNCGYSLARIHREIGGKVSEATIGRYIRKYKDKKPPLGEVEESVSEGRLLGDKISREYNSKVKALFLELQKATPKSSWNPREMSKFQLELENLLVEERVYSETLYAESTKYRNQVKLALLKVANSLCVNCSKGIAEAINEVMEEMDD